MTRKSAALSASLVAVKGAANPSADMLARASSTNSTHAPEPDASPGGGMAGAPLNFRVSETFRREFKVYAAQRGLKLNELLRRSFEAYRQIDGN